MSDRTEDMGSVWLSKQSFHSGALLDRPGGRIGDLR
jgi:hypothetical protein